MHHLRLNRRAVWAFLAGWLLWLAVGPKVALAQPPDGAAQPAAQEMAHLLNATAPPVPPFVPGVVLVGVQGEPAGGGSATAETAGDQIARAAALLGDLGVSAVEALDLRGLDGNQGAGGVTGLRLQVAPGQEWSVIEQLEQNPAVVFAEPDWLAQTAQSPESLTGSASTAEEAATQAAIETPFSVDDTLYGEQWYLQRINMSRAWALADEMGLSKIRIAVIDTGVDYEHPDLADQLLPGYNYIAPSDGPTPAVDDNGHGTHITGLIGALVDNDNGMAGAALSVEIEPYKALDANGQGPVSRIAAAIRQAADVGADIINLSLQVSVDNAELRSAINYAASREVLLIAAAGNCFVPNCAVYYPAAYSNVLAVGATTYSDQRAYYSAVGTALDLAAPGGGSGVSLLSTWAELAASKCVDNSGSRLRVVDGGLYCTADGTSMAAGVVTGVAALLMSIRPDLDAGAVRAILEETAIPTGASENEVGAGRIDAAAAVRRLLPSRLLLSQSRFAFSVPYGSERQAQTLTIQNPSLEPMSWVITSTAAVSWYGIGGPAQGVVVYGKPVHPQIVITPSLLITGSHTGSFRITGTRADGSRVILPLDVQVNITPPAAARLPLYLPIVSTGAFSAWEYPGPAGRTVHRLSGSASVGITLPFTLTLKGQTLTTGRLFADGFVTLPATTGVSSLPNQCLPNLVRPAVGLYGWWADLDPGAGQGTISTFQTTTGRFVVEYADIPAAPAANSPYRVSFQIVLQANGRVELNYGRVPPVGDGPPPVTIGVRAADGRFYNQVACITSTTELGALPRTHERLIFNPEDFY